MWGMLSVPPKGVSLQQELSYVATDWTCPLSLLVHLSVICTRCIILPYIPHIFVQIAACSSENTSGSTAECTFLPLHIHHSNCMQCNEVYVWCRLTRSGKAVGELIVSNWVEVSINNWLQDATWVATSSGACKTALFCTSCFVWIWLYASLVSADSTWYVVFSVLWYTGYDIWSLHSSASYGQCAKWLNCPVLLSLTVVLCATTADIMPLCHSILGGANKVANALYSTLNWSVMRIFLVLLQWFVLLQLYTYIHRQ